METLADDVRLSKYGYIEFSLNIGYGKVTNVSVDMVTRYGGRFDLRGLTKSRDLPNQMSQLPCGVEYVVPVSNPMFDWEIFPVIHVYVETDKGLAFLGRLKKEYIGHDYNAELRKELLPGYVDTGLEERDPMHTRSTRLHLHSGSNLHLWSRSRESICDWVTIVKPKMERVG